MSEDIFKMAAEILHITEEDVRKNSKAIPELDASYFWKPARGGMAVIINSSGEKLIAGSSVSFDKHVQAFREGRRN